MKSVLCRLFSFWLRWDVSDYLQLKVQHYSTKFSKKEYYTMQMWITNNSEMVSELYAKPYVHQKQQIQITFMLMYVGYNWTGSDNMFW